jgi:putative hydrolase of the HAD superfamily
VLRAVTYDCWNTLLRPHDETAAITLRAQAVMAALGVDDAEARTLLTAGWQRHHEAWLRGESFVSRHIATWMCEEAGVRDPDVLEPLVTAFEEASLLTGAAAVDGAVETLTALRAAGARIAVVCDSGFSPGRVVRVLFERAGLAELVDAWAFSDEVGACKPAGAMFATALQQLDVEAGEAAHVGDLWRTDVCGARGAGMRSVRFRGVFDDPPAEWQDDADLVIDRHEELLDQVLADA